MARLLPLLIFVLGLLFVLFMQRQMQRPRSDRVYRPRAGGSFGGGRAGRGSSAGDAGNWVVRRADLQGVRDAYSSAAIDPDAPLFGCTRCQAIYHATSRDALAAHNGGRCALCGSTDLRPMRVL